MKNPKLSFRMFFLHNSLLYGVSVLLHYGQYSWLCSLCVMATCGRFNKNYESLLTVLKEYDILPLYIILVFFLYLLSLYVSHYQLLFIDSSFCFLGLFWGQMISTMRP